METVLLIDGDMLAYRNAAACESSFDWGDGVTSSSSDPALARKRIDETIYRWMTDLKASGFYVCLSDERSRQFRRDLWDGYKAHRNTKAEPSDLPSIKAYLREEYDAVIWPRLEADDVMGILATDPTVDEKRIIVSCDKDMLTIPGRLYDPVKRKKHRITVEQADRTHLLQTLIGDQCDGWKGCPGIGPKRAEKFIGDWCGAVAWATVVALFEEKGLDAAHALLQARLARILRCGEYTRQTKEIKLWEPPDSRPL